MKSKFIKGNFLKQQLYIDNELIDVNISRKIKDYADGFTWGYKGQGCRQSSLALLLFFGATVSEAKEWVFGFVEDIISKIPQTDFEMPSSKVVEWLESRRLFEKEFEN